MHLQLLLSLQTHKDQGANLHLAARQERVDVGMWNVPMCWGMSSGKARKQVPYCGIWTPVTTAMARDKKDADYLSTWRVMGNRWKQLAIRSDTQVTHRQELFVVVFEKFVIECWDQFNKLTWPGKYNLWITIVFNEIKKEKKKQNPMWKTRGPRYFSHKKILGHICTVTSVDFVTRNLWKYDKKGSKHSHNLLVPCILFEYGPLCLTVLVFRLLQLLSL